MKETGAEKAVLELPHLSAMMLDPCWKPLAQYLVCVPAPIRLGNLLEEDLKEIWVQNRLLNHIRNREVMNGSCRMCRYRYLCGGCRFTAYVAQGDWLGSDTSCPFGPKR